MLRCSVERRAASAAEVDAALASLGATPGVYFGCDAGVAGLHPLQATLLTAPSLALQVFAGGVLVAALDAFGTALLAHPALHTFAALAGRAEGRSALACLRAFLAAFEASSSPDRDGGVEALGAAGDRAAERTPGADILLVGALGFEAHALAMPVSTASGGAALGVLFFATTLLRRDERGSWQHVSLHFDDPLLSGPVSAESPRATRRGLDRDAVADGPPSAHGHVDAPDPQDDFALGAYAAVVARAVERLSAQPLVSLTLSQSFRRRIGSASPAAAFATLRRANPAPATFFVNTGLGECVFGASPDLQLCVRDRAIESFPVCGTVARGHGPVGEAESFRQLINEAVDAASLAVCTDALRNDLAPLCEPGSLRLSDRRRPMALATVVHTVDRFGGRLRDGVDAWDAIVATAAPVMVTGTPRRLALAAIADLEAGPRGWYGGLVVQVAANGDALVGTMLRAAAIRDGIAEVRTGGDLLADSEPAREEHESRIKAVSLWRALGLSVADELQASMAGAATDRTSGGTTSTPGSAASDAQGEVVPPPTIVLCNAGDPFGPAVADALRALGVTLDVDVDADGDADVEADAHDAAEVNAPPVVLIGADPVVCGAALGRGAGLVAIGDAAARVLEIAGFAVAAIRPEHGRLVRCVPVAGTPGLAAMRPFSAMRCATLEVEPDWRTSAMNGGGGWRVWLHDERGRALALADARRRIVCLLFRPESLLSDPEALDVLRIALAFAAAPIG